MQPTPQLPTVGVISRRLGVSTHQVSYVIRTRGIEPAGRAGVANVYTEADVDRIAGELKRIQADREVPKW